MTTKMRVEGVTKIFGPTPKRALRMIQEGASKAQILEQTGHVVGVSNASFEVAAGEIFVVMGLSGSGKSTLIRCLNRLIEPTSGHVWVDDQDVLAADPKQLRTIRRTKMAMVFQHFGLFPHRTVAENAAYGLKVRGFDEAEQRERAVEALGLVGLAEWADHYPSNLSGGMQQRVGLARALATDPDILLMDEAFSALDPLIRTQMQDELLDLQTRLDKTVIFITHDLNEALRLGSHIAVMRDGSVIQIGTPAQIITQPVDDYVADFTQDVDRGRVLNAEFVMKPLAPLRLGEDTVQSALLRMDEEDLRYAYVVDAEGQPQGYVRRWFLFKLMNEGEKDLQRGVKLDFPRTSRLTPLTELYQSASEGVPIAVLDANGAYQGVVYPRDVLGGLAMGHTEAADREAGTTILPMEVVA